MRISVLFSRTRPARDAATAIYPSTQVDIYPSTQAPHLPKEKALFTQETSGDKAVNLLLDNLLFYIKMLALT